jgi:hypothetical protein
VEVPPLEAVEVPPVMDIPFASISYESVEDVPLLEVYVCVKVGGELANFCFTYVYGTPLAGVTA